MRLFAVIGSPIKHSLSPQMHNATIRAFNINAYYDRFYLPSGICVSDLRRFILDSSLCGLNVTVPLKEIAIKAIDYPDSLSCDIGAINTIVKGEDSRLYGYNTDVFGLYSCVSKLHARNILILGAGGSAKSAVNVLSKSGAHISVANRSAGRLSAFENIANTLTFDTLQANIQPYDLIINATSAGANGELPLSRETLKELFESRPVAFDLMYSRDSITEFCRFASECGIRYVDGKSMLVYQGAKSFLYFHSLGNDVLDDVIRHMSLSINANI